MRKNSSLFLMELILAILVFSMASTVCIQLFAKAHVMTQNSIALNQSVIQCQNMAEVICGLDADMDAFLKAVPDMRETKNGRYEAYYDDDWAPASSDAATYRITLLVDPLGEDKLAHVTITSYKLQDNSEIFTLPITKYVGGGAAG